MLRQTECTSCVPYTIRRCKKNQCTQTNGLRAQLKQQFPETKNNNKTTAATKTGLARKLSNRQATLLAEHKDISDGHALKATLQEQKQAAIA